MSRWIGGTYAGRAGWEHLEALADIGDRMAGSGGERRGAKRTRAALADAGIADARIEPFDILGWQRESSQITPSDGEPRADCIALPRSPSGSASGALVDLGPGDPVAFDEADLAGAVVVVLNEPPPETDRVVPRREKYRRAVEAGATAFVFQHAREGGLPLTGNVGTVEGEVGEIPAVGVSKELGRRLVRWNETVTVDVSATHKPATSRNVHATLGPEADEEVLVLAHVDGHDVGEGAVDNGSGAAMLVEIAASLADRESDLERAVRLVAVGAEEVGFLGSRRCARRLDPREVAAAINVDSVATDPRLQVMSHGFDALADTARTAADRLRQPIDIDSRLLPYSDHWPFVQEGVPSMATTTVPPGRESWIHTAADTFDKVRPRIFHDQAVFLTECVAAVANGAVDPEPREPGEIAEELEAGGLATGLKMVDDWPFE